MHANRLHWSGSYQWLFGTNDSTLRKDIINALNLRHYLRIMREDLMVHALMPFLDNIRGLSKMVIQFLGDRYHYLKYPVFYTRN